MAELHRWFYVRYRADGEVALAGVVYRHPRATATGHFQDGHHVVTSRVVWQTGPLKYQTLLGTDYELIGEPGTEQDWLEYKTYSLFADRITEGEFHTEIDQQPG